MAQLGLAMLLPDKKGPAPSVASFRRHHSSRGAVSCSQTFGTVPDAAASLYNAPWEQAVFLCLALSQAALTPKQVVDRVLSVGACPNSVLQGASCCAPAMGLMG